MGGIMMHVGDILSTVEGIQYRGDMMSTIGVFSTVGDTILCILSTVRGYHDTCGGIS